MSEIRLASEADLSGVAALERECFSDPWSEDSFRSELGEDSIFLVCGADGIDGFCILRLLTPECEILNVAVRKEARRSGVGKALLQEAVTLAEGRGADTFFLEVREQNIPARALYEALGFTAVGRRKRYYSHPTEDAILMQLRKDDKKC